AHQAADLTDLSRIPITSATPFNKSQALVVSLLKDKIEQAQQDVFRLAEMQTKRTVLERSINHPLFGLYPASYMWGKVLPEIVKFIAATPFGLKTGGGLYSALDAQAAIALRREWDPEFDAKIEELGHSQAMSF